MISSYIVTGFLGSGKTTLLINTVQNYFKDKRIAIIVNEFGKVGVDGKILKNTYSQVLELSEGCICCQISIEFEKGVIEIIQNYNPEIIFVETSGTSEPFPIFVSLQNLGISVEGIICVIDTKNFDNYKEHATAKYQIGGSNIIVLNKIDLVDEKTVEHVEREIREIKEKYNVKNFLTDEPIFKTYAIYKTSFGKLPKEIFEGTFKLDEIIEIGKEGYQTGHIVKDSFSEKIVYLPDGIEFKEIEKILSNLPQNVYRVKGIVKTKDVPSPILINYVFGDVSYSEISSYNGRSFLVLIGSNIDTQKVIRLN